MVGKIVPIEKKKKSFRRCKTYQWEDQ